MYAGSYDYIADQIELYGEKFVNELLDKGYEPVRTDKGWRWLLVTDQVKARRA